MPIAMLELPGEEIISSSWICVAETASRVLALEDLDRAIKAIDAEILRVGGTVELWQERARAIEFRENLLNSVAEDVTAALS